RRPRISGEAIYHRVHLRMIRRRGIDQGLLEVGHTFARNKMRRYSSRQDIGALQPGAGQPEIHAQLARTAWQEVGPSNIGKQADPGLRHRKGGKFGNDPMAAMDGEANAAAHEDAVDQRDEGLSKFADDRVAAVFVVPEGDRKSVV